MCAAKRYNPTKPPRSVFRMIGGKFGRLLVLSFSHSTKKEKQQAKYYLLCKCKCGNTVTVHLSQIRRSLHPSCGCSDAEIKSKRFKKHGLSNSSIYQRHAAMKERCYNPKNKKYPIYGGRGIVVCRAWRGRRGFENFLKDMGMPPENTSLDRIDGNLNYSCGKCEECSVNGWKLNCRWTSLKVQNNNTSRNVFIKISGDKVTLTEASNLYGVNISTLKYRIKSGWGIKRAIFTPTDSSSHKPKNILVTVEGVKMSLAEAERKLGYSRGLLSSRLKKGWTEKEAVSINPKKQS